MISKETQPEISSKAGSLRQREIVRNYLQELDKHIAELKSGKAANTFEIRDIADLLHIHPRHLSNTIKEVLDISPCAIYENKLLGVAKELLLETNVSVAEVARQLDYEPSNFSKFFKQYTGITPKKFRELNSSN